LKGSFPRSSRHALARVRELDEEHVLLCLSGRGDKDLAEVLAH
jgi:tryptophan synthase beta subunit